MKRTWALLSQDETNTSRLEFGKNSLNRFRMSLPYLPLGQIKIDKTSRAKIRHFLEGSFWLTMKTKTKSKLINPSNDDIMENYRRTLIRINGIFSFL